MSVSSNSAYTLYRARGRHHHYSRRQCPWPSPRASWTRSGLSVADLVSPPPLSIIIIVIVVLRVWCTGCVSCVRTLIAPRCWAVHAYRTRSPVTTPWGEWTTIIRWEGTEKKRFGSWNLWKTICIRHTRSTQQCLLAAARLPRPKVVVTPLSVATSSGVYYTGFGRTPPTFSSPCSWALLVWCRRPYINAKNIVLFLISKINTYTFMNSVCHSTNIFNIR